MFFNKNSFDVAQIVQQMFEQAGITPIHQDDIFSTIVNGVYCEFQAVLKCDKDDKQKLCIGVPFPIAIPRQLANVVMLELSRLNDSVKKTDSEYIPQIIVNEEKEQACSIMAYTYCDFSKEPTTKDIKDLMVHTVDLVDAGNFRSLACSIFGYTSYDEVEKNMFNSSKRSGNDVYMQLQDGYALLLKNIGKMTSFRYAGRLLVLSISFIESGVTDLRTKEHLAHNEDFWEIVQAAYDVATENGRDIIRKLVYLMSNVKVEGDQSTEMTKGKEDVINLMSKKQDLSLLFLEME